MIFCDKGRYVPILENSTGTDLGNGSKTEVCLGRDLFTSLESVHNPFAEFILLWVSYITVLSKLQRHLQKAICFVLQLSLTSFTSCESHGATLGWKLCRANRTLEACPILQMPNAQIRCNAATNTSSSWMQNGTMLLRRCPSVTTTSSVTSGPVNSR